MIKQKANGTLAKRRQTMKKLLIPNVVLLVVSLGLLGLVGCKTNTTTSSQTSTVTPASDETFQNVTETTADFEITTEDGAFTQSGTTYTITSSGTYTLSGKLEGQILVDAEEATVELDLNGVSITNSTDSPIKIVAADKVEISAKKDTDNLITDARSVKTVDTDTLGEGAIYANCDLKLKGNGVLVVSSTYNNGIHTTKDLTIKNLSLKVTAVNNAIKGNDSITMESGTVVAISTAGDGVKTQNTDVSSKGNQRGTITLTDGALTVYAAGDALQAAYDYVQDGGVLSVYTGSYSSYTASSAQTTSYKGVKVGNELTINDGTLYIVAYDDGLHADYGTTLENGAKGKGNININGGSTTITVYSPAKSTMGGRMGPGGWGNQQSVSGADGIHADNTLTISGGTVNVDSAYEGLEATYVVISGGNTTVYATDDGVNAARKVGTPSITVSGGLLDVTVPSNGDTDGIDSNGTYVQTGGVVITKGPGSASGRMGGGACALDTDGGVSLRGGTLIIFGGMEDTPSASGMTKTICSSSTVSTGSHTVNVGSSSYTTTLSSSTSGCVVYSSEGTAKLK